MPRWATWPAPAKSSALPHPAAGDGEQDLAEAALAEAKNLEKSGQMSAYGTKKLRYETRKLTQRLKP